MTLTLSEMTDSEIEAAVALHVAEIKPAFVVLKRGLYWRPEDKGYTSRIEEAGRYTEEEAKERCADGEDAVTMRPLPVPHYLTDLNALIPLLKKWAAQDAAFRQIELSYHAGTYAISLRGVIGGPFGANAPTLNRAAVLALLRSVPGLCKGER